jgi:hypothetical protein
VPQAGEGANQENKLCCETAINNWESDIRQPIFAVAQTLIPNLVNIATLLAGLQPMKLALEGQFRSNSWFNFCSKRLGSISPLTGQPRVIQTDIRLLTNVALQNINQVQANAFNSVPMQINIPSNLSYLLPNRQALANQYSTCINANSNLWSLPFSVLGIQYSFNPSNDPDLIIFTDTNGNNIIPPAVYGTLGQVTIPNLPVPTAQQINNAFIPITALNGANSFNITVRPVGTNLQQSIFTLSVSLVVLDPWPSEH